MKNNFARPGYFSVSIKYFFILFFFSGLLLTGCGGSDDEDPAPTNNSGQGSGNGDGSGSSQDTTPPEIDSISPEDGATDVPVGVTIEVTFSEPIDINSVTNTSLILSGGASNSIRTTVTVSNSTGLMTIDPDNDLQKDTEYLLRLSGLKDKAGNELSSDFSMRFTTVEDDFVNVVTNEVNNITETSADVSGSFTTNISVTEKGFVYRQGQVSPTIDDEKIIVNSGSSSEFTFGLSGLNPAATYQVRAYTQSSIGVSYGQTRSFTTLATPTVQTKNAEGVINRSGFVGGQVDAKGRNLEQYGIVWSLSANPDLNDNVIESSGSIADFTEEVRDRDVNQTIYYKAYAITSGTGLVVYGSEKSFTTLNIKTSNIESLRYSNLSNRTIIGEMYINGLISGFFKWLEVTSDASYQFIEYDFDEWSIYMEDSSRGVRLQIDLFVGSIFILNNDGSKSEIYKIREMYVDRDFTNAAPSGRQMRR